MLRTEKFPLVAAVTRAWLVPVFLLVLGGPALACSQMFSDEQLADMRAAEVFHDELIARNQSVFLVEAAKEKGRAGKIETRLKIVEVLSGRAPERGWIGFPRIDKDLAYPWPKKDDPEFDFDGHRDYRFWAHARWGRGITVEARATCTIPTSFTAVAGHRYLAFAEDLRRGHPHIKALERVAVEDDAWLAYVREHLVRNPRN